MTWVDWAILGILGVSAGLSLFRGFVREAIALAGWFAGLWVGFNFMHVAAGWLVPWIENPSLRLVAGFVALLAGVLLVTGLVSRLLRYVVDTTGLGGTDRVIGMIFGAVRGALIVAGVVLLAGFTALPQDPGWRESVLVPQFRVLAAEVQRILPDEVSGHLRR